MKKPLYDKKTQHTNTNDPLDPHVYEDTVIPANDEYYTLGMNRSESYRENTLTDIVATEDDDMTLTPSSSLYDGVSLTDVGGLHGRDEVFDQNTVSLPAGTPGHPGIDEDTG